jgi:acyl-CoA thioester hydrolase
MEGILVKHTTKLRVRYSETDQMGIVYYGNYAQYFEVARVEFLRDLGFVYKELEEIGIIMPVVRFETDFKFPAKYDEELSVVTSINTVPTSKITFDYEVINPEGVLVCTAKVILVFLNKSSFRPVRTPKSLVELLKKQSEL